VNTFGLDIRALELIREVLRRHPEVCGAKIFGSRAMDAFEANSDVDLALWGALNPGVIARIRGELDELPLPYAFDVLAYDAITHPPLRQHIDEVGRPLYPARPTG
jgi:uncharacterized protein